MTDTIVVHLTTGKSVTIKHVSGYHVEELFLVVQNGSCKTFFSFDHVIYYTVIKGE